MGDYQQFKLKTINQKIGIYDIILDINFKIFYELKGMEKCLQ